VENKQNIAGIFYYASCFQGRLKSGLLEMHCNMFLAGIEQMKNFNSKVFQSFPAFISGEPVIGSKSSKVVNLRRLSDDCAWSYAVVCCQFLASPTASMFVPQSLLL